MKKISSIAVLMTAAVVMICICWSLDGYIPPVYQVDAAEEHTMEEEKQTQTQEEVTLEDQKILEQITTSPVIAAISEHARYKNGTYYGNGKGFAGTITVRVVIEDGKIAAITITQSQDGDDYIKKASAVISAMINGQSTNVDTVSGATYSSVGIIEAVRDALKKAIDESSENIPEETRTYSLEKNSSIVKDTTVMDCSTIKEKRAYKDGIYYGTGEGFAGTIKVKVTVKNGKISDISVIESADGAEYMDLARKLLQRIVKEQTTNVDVVSGATYSSNGLIAAVRDALKNAVVEEKTTAGEMTSERNTTISDHTTDATQNTTIKGNLPYKDGVYYGTGEGYRGSITVAVVIEDGAIRYILITQADDDDAFISKAKAVIQRVLKQQTAEVDVVSGATFSSQGILEAIKNALKEAKGITDGETQTTTEKERETTKPSEEQTTSERKYRNGTYTAEVVCSPDEAGEFEEYHLSVSVTVKNDVITSITDVKGVGKGYDSYNDWYIKRAAEGTAKYQGVVNQILGGKGLSDVDTVSGATCSSKAMMEAVKKALAQGEVK